MYDLDISTDSMDMNLSKLGEVVENSGCLVCYAGEGNGTPLQCSCLENPRDGGAWWAAISVVAQGRTRLRRLSSSSSSILFSMVATPINIPINSA